MNTEETEQLFANAYQYQPSYFPDGMAISIIKNDLQADLPWTFQLPFKGQKKYDHAPTDHSNGIKALTKAVFEYQNVATSAFLNHFKDEAAIAFRQSTRNWLTLNFDKNEQAKQYDFEELSLTV